jgi:hypothetical protein
MARKSCVVGYYFTPEAILEAAARVRDRKFKNWDTFTPFPVHGIDEAMGLKRSWLPYVSFAAGAAGFGGGAFLTIWTHYFSWPINISGKPMLALPAYIPVIFETTVLLAGVTTVAFMFTFLLKLPNYFKPIFHPDLTCNRFAVAVEVSGSEEAETVKKFLKEIQAAEVHEVEGEL